MYINRFDILSAQSSIYVSFCAPYLIEEIIYQKRVEFWGEGLEYIDNRRLNIPVDRTDETWGAENNNHFSAAKFRYNQEERPFLYQLPISEIENNSQISPSDQN